MTPTPRAVRAFLAAVPLCAAVLALTTGCGSSTAKANGSQKSDMAKYVQTWGTDYDHTTCTQWAGRMSDQQRWTAAFEMLRDNRGSDAAIAAMPGDALVTRFKADIDTRCSSKAAADTAVSDTASDAYLAGRSGYRK